MAVTPEGGAHQAGEAGEARDTRLLTLPALRPKPDATRRPVTDGLEDLYLGLRALPLRPSNTPSKGQGLLGAPFYR